jgi:hypothetical protein
MGCDMNIKELPYEKRLVVEMMHYSVWACKKTQDKKPSEIKQALSFFFSDKEIDWAIDLLSGKIND